MHPRLDTKRARPRWRLPAWSLALCLAPAIAWAGTAGVELRSSAGRFTRDARPRLRLPEEVLGQPLPSGVSRDDFARAWAAIEQDQLRFRAHEGALLSEGRRYRLRLHPDGDAELSSRGPLEGDDPRDARTWWRVRVRLEAPVVEQACRDTRAEQLRRLATPAGPVDLVERWDAGLEALEQSFLLLRRPPGAGSLDLPLAFDVPPGHTLGRDGHVLVVRDAGGAVVLRVSAPVAFDRLGLRHDLTFALDGRQVRITLPRALLDVAAYPLLVDPVYDPVWKETGSGGGFGASIAAGDLDPSDAEYEFVVGDPSADTNDGAVYYFSGVGTAFSVAQKFSDPTPGDRRFGSSVWVDDVNDLGGADLLVGMHTYLATSAAGSAYVFLGGSPPDTTADLTLTATGVDRDDLFGFAVHVAKGDVFVDIFDSVRMFVGAPGSDAGGADAGAVYGFDATGLDLVRVDGAAGQWLGRALATGNLDGDASADPLDLVIGCSPDGSQSGAIEQDGQVLILFQGQLTEPGLTVTSPEGAASDGHFGWSVAVGDVDGDGLHDDLLVGEPGLDLGGISNRGAAHLYFMGQATPDTTVDWTYRGGVQDDQVGVAVRIADTTQDGKADLGVGASTRAGFAAAPRPRALLFRGFASVGPTLPDWDRGSDDESTQTTAMGAALAFGHVAGDRFTDLLVGDPTRSTAYAFTSAGRQPRLNMHSSANATDDPARTISGSAHQELETDAPHATSGTRTHTGTDALVERFFYVPAASANLAGTWNFAVRATAGGAGTTVRYYVKVDTFDPATDTLEGTYDFDGGPAGANDPSRTLTLAAGQTEVVEWSHDLSSATALRTLGPSSGVVVHLFATSGADVTTTCGDDDDAYLAVPDASVTAVTLTGIEATGFDAEVLVEWTTGAELDALGFNVYRGDAPDGELVQVNAALIAAQGDSLAGARYHLLDRTVENDRTYRYVVEDVESGGRVTLHPPVTATPRAGAGAAAVDPSSTGEVVGPGALDGPAAADGSRAPGALDEGLRVRVVEVTATTLVADLLVPRFARRQVVVDDATYDLIELPGFAPSTDLDRPVVPKRRVLIELPAATTAALADVEGAAQTFDGYRLPANLRNHAPPPVSRLGPVPPWHDGSSPWPAAPAAELGLEREGPRTFLALELAPVRAVTGPEQVLFHERIRVRLTLRSSGDAAADLQATERTQVALATSPGVAVITVEEDAVHRVDHDDLVAAGFDVSRDPRRLWLWNRGRAVPCRVLGEDDGRLDPGDAIEFLGRRNPATFVDSAQTRYADENAYWLAWGPAPGPRAPEVDAAPRGGAPAAAALATVRAERQALVRHWPFEPPGKDHWFSDQLVGGGSSAAATYTLRAWAPAPPLGGARLRYRVRGASVPARASPHHHVEVLLNGRLVDAAAFDGRAEVTGDVPASGLAAGDNTVTLRLPGGSDDRVLVDWVELTYPRRFVSEDRETFRGATPPGPARVENLASSDLTLWDVSDPAWPRLLTGAQVEPTGVVFQPDGSLARGASWQATFDTAGAGAREVLVATAGGARAPSRVALHAPARDLLARSNGADLIVITSRALAPAAERLAAYRRGRGLRATVVFVDEVMDQFAWGNLDPSAFARFLRRAWERWAPPAPKYVVLLGDGHYDYHDHIGTSAPNHVPPVMIETAHAWVASDNRIAAAVGDDALPDLRLGRLPARDLAEAQRMVDKVIAYEGAPFDPVGHRNVLLVADDADVWPFGRVAADLARGLPPDHTVARAFFPVDGDPAAIRQRIIDTLGGPGALLTVYVGHGNLTQWGAEGLFVSHRVTSWSPLVVESDLDRLTNVGRPTVVLVLNCQSGDFSHTNPDLRTMGEAWLRHDGGGAVAVWASTGLTEPRPQEALARRVFERIFTAGEGVLGDAIDAAKLQLAATDAGSQDVIDTWTLLGDPATSLARAQRSLARPNAFAPATPSEPVVVAEPSDAAAPPPPGRASGSCALLVPRGSPSPSVLPIGCLLAGLLALAVTRRRTSSE